MKKSLILCGLPMSGKSTIGQMLASQLSIPFIDTDRLIEQAFFLKSGSAYTCRQIFIEEGEANFRILEKDQIASLKLIQPCVIALGGGCLSDQENLKNLNSLGQLVYLKASVKMLLTRIMSQKNLPAYLDRSSPEISFSKLAAQRIVNYEAAAQIIIDTDGLSEDDVVAHILKYDRQ